jgi:hemerythrin-like domain-containing protein
MSGDDVDLMSELIEEHEYSRKTIEEIEAAYKNHKKGQDSLNILVEKLKVLTEVYPKHIEKEDNAFFPDSEKYFSEKEQEEMLEEFWKFDRKMIHEKYKAVVDKLKIQ